MRNLLVASMFSILSTAVFAETSTYVMLDGSVASCVSKEDVNGKAFKLSAVVDSKGLQFIKIENLICQKKSQQSEKTYVWKQKALSTETSVETSLGVVKNKTTKAALQITDFEGYVEIQSIKLDVNLAEQTVLLSDKVTEQNKVVAVLQTYQKTSLNDVVQDEGYNLSGHFVISF